MRRSGSWRPYGLALRDVLARHSYEELLSLLDWFTRRGPIPTIIGGWAVYFYNGYLGSVDIDLVSYSMSGMFDQLLLDFEMSQSYEEVKTDPLGLGTSYMRPVLEGGRVVGYVEIDACTFESDPRVFHEDESKELPYELCGRRGLLTRVDLDGDREAYIPVKPLLFLYKLKAFRDREHDLKTRGAVLPTSRREWLRAKWIKDGSDMMAILDPEPETSVIEQVFDSDVFWSIVEEHDLKFCLDTFQRLPSLAESRALYPNASEAEISEWVGCLQKEV